MCNITEQYTQSIKDGEATITTSNTLTRGSHNVNSTYNQSNKYQSSTTSSTLLINGLPTTLTGTTEYSITIGETALIELTLTSNEDVLSDQTLTFYDTNGENIGTPYTNGEGYAYINFVPSTSGTHTITVIYEGNDTYASCSTQITVTVHKRETYFYLYDTEYSFSEGFRVATNCGTSLGKCSRLTAYNIQELIDLTGGQLTIDMELLKDASDGRCHIGIYNPSTGEFIGYYNPNPSYLRNDTTGELTEYAETLLGKTIQFTVTITQTSVVLSYDDEDGGTTTMTTIIDPTSVDLSEYYFIMGDYKSYGLTVSYVDDQGVGLDEIFFNTDNWTNTPTTSTSIDITGNIVCDYYEEWFDKLWDEGIIVSLMGVDNPTLITQTINDVWFSIAVDNPVEGEYVLYYAGDDVYEACTSETITITKT